MKETLPQNNLTYQAEAYQLLVDAREEGRKIFHQEAARVETKLSDRIREFGLFLQETLDLFSDFEHNYRDVKRKLRKLERMLSSLLVSFSERINATIHAFFLNAYTSVRLIQDNLALVVA